MRRRFVSLLAAAAVPLLVAGCTDESPTLQGGEFFPEGRPVTLRSTLAAGDFFGVLGRFSGYPASFSSPSFLVIAEDFGTLDSHLLVRFAFPAAVEYNQLGQSRRDTVYTLTSGRMVAPIDSASSAYPGTGPVTFQLWELAQAYDQGSATWELAVDSGAVRTRWTEPGGTRGTRLAQYVWNPAQAGDSVQFQLDSATVNRIAGNNFAGLMVTVSPGARVQTAPFTLRTGAHPANARPDTVLNVNVSEGGQRYVFTPQPPRATTELEVGGIASARSLVRIDLDQTVPACAPGVTPCARVPLRDVTLNEVALLLRPVTPPGGFQVLDTASVTLVRVQEPELGARAPLGEVVVGSRTRYDRGDTVVAVNITNLARQLAANDTADLVGEFALISVPEAATFGVLFFEPTPRLRITYTLPPRPRVP